MLKRVDVAVLPAEALAMPTDAYVVVDALRATTTIATLFHRGLKDLVVADDIDAARRAAREERRLLFGEVGGLRPDGFDYGNSPIEAQAADVEGRRAVLFTTNGTTALCALGDHATVYAGAPANASSIARAVGGYERVVLVCAGTDGARGFAQEDFVAAGLIVRVLQRAVRGIELGDAAALAARLAGEAEPTLELLHEGGARPTVPIGALPSPGQILLTTSEHARRLKALGLGRDVAFCAQLDTSHVAPMVVGCGPGWALLRNAAQPR